MIQPLRGRHQDRSGGKRVTPTDLNRQHWRQQCANADAANRAAKMAELIKRAESGKPLFPESEKGTE